MFIYIIYTHTVTLAFPTALPPTYRKVDSCNYSGARSTMEVITLNTHSTEAVQKAATSSKMLYMSQCFHIYKITAKH